METVELPRDVVYIGHEMCSELSKAESREILVTNGIGGYGSHTLANSLNRSYHGLLIAALRPPLDRTLLLSKLNETVMHGDKHYPLFADRRIQNIVKMEKVRKLDQNKFSASEVSNKEGKGLTYSEESNQVGHASASLCQNEIIVPEGFKLPRSFHLEGTVPVFEYSLGKSILEKKIWMKRGQNTVYVSYYLRCASQAVQLRLEALVNYRNHHGRTSKAETRFNHSISLGENLRSVAVQFAAENSGTVLNMMISTGRAEVANEWVSGFVLKEECRRGLPELDDNLHAATFVIELVPETWVTFAATAENDISSLSLDGKAELTLHHAYEQCLLKKFQEARALTSRNSSQANRRDTGGDDLDARSRQITTALLRSNVNQLVLAADQFIVSRDSGYSVIAGFHWFTDWTRDTMISLPGLTIVTGRYEVARLILLTFSKYVSNGMLPNRFLDDGSSPTEGDYNNVDGTLWYFEAIRIYYLATADAALLEELYPILQEIITYHCRGTRFGIRQDSDGLLLAGTEELALTWMDAKTDVVHTPRCGKAVEVAALWFNALSCMAFFAGRVGNNDESHAFYDMAQKTKHSFQQKFWNHTTGYCYDVIDGGPSQTQRDASLRPNQLIAASLGWSPLTTQQRALVLDVCTRNLLTSNSVRSLCRQEKNYKGIYRGDVLSRDSSYHQGVGWPWLLGPFTLAHLRVYGNKELSRRYLLPILRFHLSEVGLGQISELFDGDPPYHPKGCIAQAWSVAELLRAWAATDTGDSLQSSYDEI